MCVAVFRLMAALGIITALSACVSGPNTTEHVGERPGMLSNTTSYIDAQERELRELLAESGVSVERARDDIILKTPGPGAFEPEVADVSPAFRDQLVALAPVLNKYQSTLIEVCGYTDTTGSMIGNMALSLHRAEAVAQLLESLGVAGQRITAKGLGPLQPVADNETAEGRQLNRLVELTIRPAARATLSVAASD
jgi:outer membrane protein OmpA-like peptidoglycan-associated protein